MWLFNMIKLLLAYWSLLKNLGAYPPTETGYRALSFLMLSFSFDLIVIFQRDVSQVPEGKELCL